MSTQSETGLLPGRWGPRDFVLVAATPFLAVTLMSFAVGCGPSVAVMPEAEGNGGSATRPRYVAWEPDPDPNQDEERRRARLEADRRTRAVAGCELLGRELLVPGSGDQQAVWHCGSGRLVVEDGSRVLGETVREEVVPPAQGEYAEGVTVRAARLVNVIDDGPYEVVLEIVWQDWCGGPPGTGLVVVAWRDSGLQGLRAVWTDGNSAGDGDCMGDGGPSLPSWWPTHTAHLRRPELSFANGEISWFDHPMVWERTSERFVPSPEARAAYDGYVIAEVRRHLDEGRAVVAHALLPENATGELVLEVRRACADRYLRALRDADQPTQEDLEMFGREALVDLKVQLIRNGLRCAPEEPRLLRAATLAEAELERVRAVAEAARRAEQRRRVAAQARRARQLTRERNRAFQTQTAGPFRFRMTRGQARRACRRDGGTWDASQSLVACDVAGVTFGAGFCGNRACSVYVNAAGPSAARRHRELLEALGGRYGSGRSRRRGRARVTTWRLDEQREIELVLANIRGRDMLSVSFWSQGRR